MIAGIDNSLSECLMGHANGLNSLSSRYSGLKDGDDEAIAYLKEEYVKALPYLETDFSDGGQGYNIDGACAHANNHSIEKIKLPERIDLRQE